MKMTSKIVFGVFGFLLGGAAIFNGIAEQIEQKKTNDDTNETTETLVETAPATTTTENP